jgi:mono/diheme cytochrome c family protein
VDVATDLFALFATPEETGEAVRRLSALGVADRDITILSHVPYEPEVVGRSSPQRGGMGPVGAIGGALGVLTALLLAGVVFLLYPLDQGGQPVLPFPPSIIILVEVTMLVTMWTLFFGFVLVNRMPTFGRPAYSQEITAGKIGLLTPVASERLESAVDALRQSGAEVLEQLDSDRQPKRRDWRLFIGLVGGMLVLAIVALLMFTYNSIRIQFASEMENQESIAYVQGPRLAAPTAAVPIQGPVLIGGQVASEPVAATAESLQRGGVLFGITCAVCHGETGRGDGPLAGYFSPGPRDLTTADIQQRPKPALFLVVTQGFGVMPSLQENLAVQQRWDVINYVLSLSE